MLRPYVAPYGHPNRCAEQHQLSRIEVRRRDREGDLQLGEARGGNETRNRALQRLGLQGAAGEHALGERPGVEGGEVVPVERERDPDQPVVARPRGERGAHHRAHRGADDVGGPETGFEEGFPRPRMSEALRTTAAKDRHHPRHPHPSISDRGFRIADSTIALPIRNSQSAIRNCYSPAPVSYRRSITREARRFDARSYRRFSSAVSGTIGGTCVGTPCSSSATYVT